MAARLLPIALLALVFACKMPERAGDREYGRIDGGASTSPPPFGAYVGPGGGGGLPAGSGEDAAGESDASDATSAADPGVTTDAALLGPRYTGLNEDCPYQPATPTLNCEGICKRVESCGPDPGCEQACQDATRILSGAAQTALATCIGTTACQSLGEGAYLQDVCITSALASLSPSGSQVCGIIAAKAQACGSRPDQALAERQLCDSYLARILRPEAANAILQCASVQCSDINACVRGALCGYPVRLENGVLQAFP
jgi:hypothetical protein